MMCSDAPVRDILTKLIHEETFIFKNKRLASTGTRFSKPVRARTGSELQRERVLSLGIKRELGRESEKTRREAKEIITTRYLIPSYTRAWRHESKTASRLQSTRAWFHENMRERDYEGSRARKHESITSCDGLTRALRALVGRVEGDAFWLRAIIRQYLQYNLQTDNIMIARENESMRAWELESMNKWDIETIGAQRHESARPWQ